MKRLIYAMILAPLFLTGCMEDKGTYDYLPVNKVTISRLDNEQGEAIGNITVATMSILKLTPVMSESVPGTGDEYRYRWYIYQKGVSNSKEMTISEERDLEWAVATSPGKYEVRYVVTNAKTEVSSYYSFEMTVVKDNVGTLMIASNVDGKANLTVMKPDGTWVSDIYEKANGYAAGSNAVVVVNARQFQSEAVNNSIILCDDGEGGAFFNNESFEMRSAYRDIFYEAPQVIKPQGFFRGFVAYGTGDQLELLINDGKIHYRLATKVASGAKFSPAFEGDYYMHPCGSAGWGTNLFYDNKNYRFWVVSANISEVYEEYRIKLQSAYLYGRYAYDANRIAAFNPDDVGLKMIYFSVPLINWEDIGYAIMCDPADPSKLYRLSFFGGGLQEPTSSFGSNYWYSFWKRPIEAQTEIASAKSFTMARNNPYIYYSSGSRIYMYNAENDNNRMILDVATILPGNQVDLVYIQNDDNNAEDPSLNYRLYVAASPEGGAGKCGSIVDVRLMTNGEYESHTVHSNVVGKVVSMDHQM
ncbi:hypothetical protein LJC45_01435 [Alistipes sp. OttesenSCG-928-B03]|nr:hypothetical protein [Alistipes sp. OttesenSCG-928-B03]